MKKPQSRSASKPRDSDVESQSDSGKSHGRGPVAEQEAELKGKGRTKVPGESSSDVKSAKRKSKKSKKSLPPPAEPSEDEALHTEPEAEETECGSLSAFEMLASGVFDDDTLCDPDFDFAGADLYLKAGGRHFWVHTHVFKDFDGLKSEFDSAPIDEDEGYRLLALEDSVEDIRRVLAVLYTKPYEPHDFDFGTLESCLKLATKYDNHGLRTYAIQELEHSPLETIDSFRLGRDYELSEWCSRSASVLTNRDEPITAAEATILGPATFAGIAAARERVQYARGHRERLSLLVPPVAPAHRAVILRGMQTAADSSSGSS